MVKPHISALGWEVVLALVELSQPSPKYRSAALSPATVGMQHPWVVSTPLSGSQAPPGLTLHISKSLGLSEFYRSGSSCDLRVGRRGHSPAMSRPLRILSSGGSGAGFVPSSALLYAVRAVLLFESVPWHLLHPNLCTLRQGWGHQR